MGFHALLQGIFLTPGWNQCLMSPALAGGFFTTSASIYIYNVPFHILFHYHKMLNIVPCATIAFLFIFIFGCIGSSLSSLVAQIVKRLSTMWETWVRSLGWEDPLEKEMAIHSRTIAWKIPRTEEPGRLQPMGSQRVGHD